MTDRGGNTLATPQQLTVTIRDINDNAPVCSPALIATSIDEGAAAGNGHYLNINSASKLSHLF